MKKKTHVPPKTNPPTKPTTPQLNLTPDKPPKRWPLDLHHRSAQAVVALVILLLAAVAYLGLHTATNPNTTPTHSPASPPAYQAQVKLTADGFSPQTISVKANTLVSWVNQDSSPHQVAADPYPKNNSIPGFDSNQVLQPGDSYAFSFTKAGTYHLHDQLNPLKAGGTVVVE